MKGVKGTKGLPSLTPCVFCNKNVYSLSTLDPYYKILVYSLSPSPVSLLEALKLDKFSSTERITAEYKRLTIVISSRNRKMPDPQAPEINNDNRNEIEYVVDGHGYVQRDEAGQLMIFRRRSSAEWNHLRYEHGDRGTVSSDQATDGDSPGGTQSQESDSTAPLGDMAAAVSTSEPEVAEGAPSDPLGGSSHPFSYRDAEQKARDDAYVAKVQLAIFAYEARRDAPRVPHDTSHRTTDDRPSPPLQATIPAETVSDFDALNARLDEEDYDPEQIEAYLQQLELDRILAETAEVFAEGSQSSERLEQAIARGKAEGEAEFNRRMKELVDRHLPPHIRVAPAPSDLSRVAESPTRNHAAQASSIEREAEERDLDAQDERNLQRALRESRQRHASYRSYQAALDRPDSRQQDELDGHEIPNDEAGSESTTEEERDEHTLRNNMWQSAASHVPPEDDIDPSGSLQTTLRESARTQSVDISHGAGDPYSSSEEGELLGYPTFEPTTLERSSLTDPDESRANSTHWWNEGIRQLDNEIDEIERLVGLGDAEGEGQPRSRSSANLDLVSELDLGETESSSEESEHESYNPGTFETFLANTNNVPVRTSPPVEYRFFVPGEQFFVINDDAPTRPPELVRSLHMVTVEMPRDFDRNPGAARALSNLEVFLGAEQLVIHRPAPPRPILPRRLFPAERNQINDNSIITPRSLELLDAMILVLNEHRRGRLPALPSTIGRQFQTLSVQECIRFVYWMRRHGYDVEVVLRPQEHVVTLQLRVEDGMIHSWGVGFGQAAPMRTQVREPDEAQPQASGSGPATDCTRTETTITGFRLATPPGPSVVQIDATIRESNEIRAELNEQFSA
ncbi:MAG: hypothetical protein M1836_004344 [Candelina mexicana]|nr:MAG: hypothetical protein M1836_004344 [Candelina mexicana]